MLLAALFATLAQGCATGTTAVVFPEVGRIERELKPGVSTKADVERVLGSPKGKGNAVIPGAPRPHEVWDYSDIEAVEATKRQPRSGGPRSSGLFSVWADVQQRQQMLLAFFDKEVFDGFFWYSNLGEGGREAKTGTMPWAPVGTIEYGWLPRTDPLETLRPGASTKADVLLALGEPRGHGIARFHADQVSRDVWFYEFTHIESWRVHLKILVVFLHNERYDGHCWFSQAQTLEQKK